MGYSSQDSKRRRDIMVPNDFRNKKKEPQKKLSEFENENKTNNKRKIPL